MGIFWEVGEAETPSKREGLVEPRLRPPSLRGERLDRARLIERLDAGLDRKLTLVTAPAGFGKTWLVVDWLGLHSDIAQVWTSLDSRDNDATRLWHHVFSAMADELSDANLDDALFSGGVELNRILDSLSGALRECDEEVLVVLDDAHLIDDPIAVGSLESFLASAPRSSHFVLIGRHDPMVRVARLRMADDLVELRAHDLQLTVDETADMVELFLETPVAASTVSALHERTGGWIAGCRMAINSAKRSNDPEQTLAQFSGRRSDVADLITEEILPELKPREQRFLLETSLLNYLSGPLCDATTNGRGADAILERLARDEMLTIRSGTDGWYQYHELFREVLQLELRRTRPDQIPELSLRAARWLHDHSDPVEAISQALIAGEGQLAGRWLVEASRGLLSSGQDATLVALATQIDNALDEPSLAVLGTMGYTMGLAGGSLHENGHMALLKRMLEIAQRRDTSGGREGWDWPGFPFPFHGREDFIAIISGVSSRMLGDLDTVLSLENLLPTDSGMLEGVVAEGLIWMERYEEARSVTARYVRAFSHGEPGAIRGTGLLALIARGEGRLTEASALADSAMTANQDSNGVVAFAGTYALLARARLEWERGCLSRAATAIDDLTDGAIQSGSVPLWVHSRMASSRLRRSQGDRIGAAVDLDHALVIPSGVAVGEYFAERIAFEKARLALLDDNLLSAELAVPLWRKLIEDGAQSMRAHLLFARFAIVAGEDPQLLLSEMPLGCQITLPHRIQLGILKSLTAVRDHDSDLALTELTKVMRLAAVSGHRQMFLDERGTLGVLLENAAAQAGIRLRKEGTTRSEAEHKVSKIKPIDLVDPLTEREIEVLQFLPSHRTYAKIGDEMGVSMNTVKYHVKAIYRKLGVDGRSEAVGRARESGLVSLAISSGYRPRESDDLANGGLPFAAPADLE